MIEEYMSTEDEETILTKEAINKKYGLVLISSPYAESQVPPADKDVLDSRAESLGATAGTWFDVSLYKMKDIYWGDPMEKLEEEGTAKLTATAVPVSLSVEVPEELQKFDRTFYLLQCHDGKADIAAQGKDNVMSWTSDAFSTYMIAYKDEACPMVKFTDTEQDAWYHNGVHWALENGVMNGTGASTFEPGNVTDRAMIVTMLWRMEGSPQAVGNVTFKDVPDGQWYTDAIRWAAANNIVNGYDEDTFGTNESVTREQLATILYRSVQSKDQGFTGTWAFPLNFDDADQVSEWADEAMHWMTMNGIIQGMSDKELSPQGDAVRAQVATMLMRFSEKIA